MLTSNEAARNIAKAETRPTINILIVADGDLSFSSAESEALGLGRFCTMLKNASRDFGVVNVVTAHRQPVAMNTGADLPDFTFRSGMLDQYAEIWLLGHENGVNFGKRPPIALQPYEYDALIEFMDRGGGIVAAGDHEDLGKTMCGWIPRVRSMRRWEYDATAGPSANAPGKDKFPNDTLIYPAKPAQMKDVKSFERDSILQTIYLVPMAKPREWGGVKQRGIVHTIFSMKNGDVINMLPDHMHEGECLEDPDLTRRYGDGTYGSVPGQYANRPEFYRADDGYIERPQILAWSISSADDKPKPFGSVAVYDGLKVKFKDGDRNVQHGRIVAISTWHQFVNDNIAAVFDSNGAPQNLMIHDLLSQYYMNIATWVAGYQREDRGQRGAVPGIMEDDEPTFVNLQTEMRDYAITIAREYHPLINLLGSTSIKSPELKARMVADEVYDGLRTIASEAQILEWAIAIYEERQPDKRIALNKEKIRSRTETITLLTDLGVDLLAKYVMGAETAPVSFRTLVNASRNPRMLEMSAMASDEDHQREWLAGMVAFLRRDLELTSQKLDKLMYTPDTNRPFINNIKEIGMSEVTTAAVEELTRASAFSWDIVNNAIEVRLVAPKANSTVDIIFEGVQSKQVEIVSMNGVILDTQSSCAAQGVGPYKQSTVTVPSATGSFRIRPLQSGGFCPNPAGTRFANPTLDITHCDKRFDPASSISVQVTTFYFAIGLGESIQITITIEDVIE